MMYFKDDYHKALANRFMTKLGFEKLEDDREYGTLAYLFGATYKEGLLTYCDADGIWDHKLQEVMGAFSSGEKVLIRLGLQLFNSRMDDITIYDVFYPLDEVNMKVVVEALQFRYGLVDM